MENINIEHREGQGFHITDFPNAEKVIKITDVAAQELADMWLNRVDLDQAEEYLDLSLATEDRSPTQRALWKMSVITFTKCFGNNRARVRNLDITQILPHDVEGQELFVYFKNLRDRNIVHDDNAIAQCLVGAIINKIEVKNKVEKIITLNFNGEVNGEDNVNNLRNLIKMTRNYVDGVYDNLCNNLSEKLELLDHNVLIKSESLIYIPPTVEDVSRTRDKG